MFFCYTARRADSEKIFKGLFFELQGLLFEKQALLSEKESLFFQFPGLLFSFPAWRSVNPK
jgi:hypothetical protein